MMSPPAKDLLSRFMSEQDYLDSELYAEIRREYIDGSVYAMAGAHSNHNRISGNLFRKIGNHLETGSCEVFQSDMRVKVAGNYFYPDVVVDCQHQSGYVTETPVIIIEVISKSTRQLDKTSKRRAYFNIPTLLQYVLIEQDLVEVECWRRVAGEWTLPNYYYLGDALQLDALGLSVSVEAIYARVQNADVTDWFAHQAPLADMEQSEPAQPASDQI